MDKEIDIKRIKRKRNIGIGLFIIGCIIVVFDIFGIVQFSTMGGSWSITGFIIYLPSSIFGFILVGIGLNLILHNRSKASKI